MEPRLTTTPPVYTTTSLLRPYSFDPNVVISGPVNAATSRLRPAFYGPTLVVLTGSTILLYQKRGFHYISVKLHFGGVSETTRPGDPEKNANSLGLACGPKHIGNSPHMTRNNAYCEKLKCLHNN